MKKGEPPSIEGSSWRPGGCRNSSTSWPRANCGMRVSSFVLTITVRDSVGSVCRRGRTALSTGCLGFYASMITALWAPQSFPTMAVAVLRLQPVGALTFAEQMGPRHLQALMVVKGPVIACNHDPPAPESPTGNCGPA